MSCFCGHQREVSNDRQRGTAAGLFLYKDSGQWIYCWVTKRFCRTLGINIKIHSLSAFISFSAPFSFHCSYVFSWVWLPKINFIHSFWNVWTFLLTATGPMQSEVRLIFFWNLVIILSHFFPLLCFVFNVLMGSLVLQMKGSYFLQK